MLFSGKITHSVIVGLNRKGSDLEPVFDLIDIPRELLRDPSVWLEAHKVEDFLKSIEEAYSGGENLIEAIGHRCFELKAWGVLDSVLRMMQDPHDIFMQPQRFISYFISPAPPIQQISREADAITFELPISSEEYPFVTSYLRAALESLPTFMRKDMATVTWRGHGIAVNWAQKQDSLFRKEEIPTQIGPEFMQNLIGTLESVEKELQDAKRSLQQKEEELAQLKMQFELQWAREGEPVTVSSDLRSEVFRLKDYLTRAQQLVTLLVGQDRMNPQVRAAMKRVNWETVTEQAPQCFERLLGSPSSKPRAEKTPVRDAQIEFDS